MDVDETTSPAYSSAEASRTVEQGEEEEDVVLTINFSLKVLGDFFVLDGVPRVTEWAFYQRHILSYQAIK